MWIYILAGIPVLLYILWLAYSSSNNDYWAKRGVVHVLAKEIPGVWKAFLGIKPLHAVDGIYYNKYPDAPFVGTMELRMPVLMIRDPELVKKVTVKDFDHFVNRRSFHFGGEMSDHFLFNMGGSRWKSMRAAMTPTFTSGKMRRMFQHFEKSSKELADFIEKQKSASENAEDDEKAIIFETREAFGRFAMDVIGSTAFGIDSQCLVNEKSPFYEQGNNLQKVTLYRGLQLFGIIMLPKLSKYLGFSFMPKEPTKFFSSIVRRHLVARRAQYDQVKKSGAAPSDFLQLMVQAQKQDLKDENEEDDLADFEKEAKIGNVKNEQISDIFIIANSMGFFTAGFDNTEAILSTAAYYSATCPEYQERLREEVDRVVAEYDGKVTYDGVVKMTYLDMFISECLRLHAPATRFERKVTKEYKIPKMGDYPEVTLPVGALVVFPVMAFHKDPKHWPNPDVFDPERFNAENKAKRHPYVYMPFGLGPRSCIAMRFVLTEIKAAVANLILRFEIQTCKETTIPMKLQELQAQHRPAAGLKLALVKRD